MASAAPANFLIEPQQRVIVVFEFSPQGEGDFNAQVTILNFLQNGQRPFVYSTTLRGTGIEERAPDIELSANSISLRIEEPDAEDEASLTIFNRGDAELSWNIPAFGAGWLTIAPRNGRIAANANGVVRFTTNDLPDENGEYQVNVTIASNDPDDDEIRLPVTLTMDVPNLVTQRIALDAGWQMISLNVSPGDDYREGGAAMVRLILAPIVERVTLIKDGEGRFAIPERNYWGLSVWTPQNGYSIRMSQNSELAVEGEVIPSETPIDLVLGWNLIAYYPDRAMLPRDALGELFDEGVVQIIKNGQGDFQLPGIYEPNWVMRPGEGYMIKVNRAIQFHYPAGE